MSIAGTPNMQGYDFNKAIADSMKKQFPGPQPKPTKIGGPGESTADPIDFNTNMPTGPKPREKGWWEKMYPMDIPEGNFDYHTSNWGDARPASAWANMARGQQDERLRGNLDALSARSLNNTQNVYGQLAARGGLTGGAMERLGNQANRANLLSNQGAYRDNNINMMDIGMKDQTMGYQSDLAADQINNQSMMHQNAHDMKTFEIQADAWGNLKEHEVLEDLANGAGGGGGGGGGESKSWYQDFFQDPTKMNPGELYGYGKGLGTMTPTGQYDTMNRWSGGHLPSTKEMGGKAYNTAKSTVDKVKGFF